MNSKRTLLTLIGALLLGASTAVAQEAPDTGMLANQIVEGRKQNHMMMRDYSWHRRTEIKMDGEVKSVKVDMLRFTPDGELQTSKISDSADGQKKPRGIKGRVAGKKVKEMQEWAADLSGLLQKYSLPTAGNLLDFMNKAKVERNGQMATAVAQNVVQQGDQMTMLVDTASKQMRMAEIKTKLDGDDVHVEMLNEKLDGGPSYTARQIVKVPAQKIELTVENFNFQKQ